MSSSLRSPWIVCQIGAREHFSIARALRRVGCDVTLLTDYWSGRSLFFKRMKQRFHHELVGTSTVGFNSQFVRFEMASRLVGCTGWKRIVARNHLFSRQAARWLDKTLSHSLSPPVIFSYSYAANEIFKIAKKHGCQTVLGQIDPGPFEAKLVESLCQKAGLNSEIFPPEAYWKSWKEECELADDIVVNSLWSKEALLLEGIPDKKIRIIPLVYEPISIPPEIDSLPEAVFSHNRPLHILFLGQVIARKGVVELCEAIEKLKNSPVKWTIVGGGDAVLMKRLEKLPQVCLVGSVTRAEVESYYRHADMFLLPTHSDGFALTQLEAAAFGLPIIASKNCGDVVRHGENGLLLESVTGQCIAETILFVLDRPGLLRQFAQSQRSRPALTLNDLGSQLVSLVSPVTAIEPRLI